MGKIVDYLAEEELKAAEQMVAEIFEVKPAKQMCRSAIVRKVGKHERMEKLVKDLRAKSAAVGR